MAVLCAVMIKLGVGEKMFQVLQTMKPWMAIEFSCISSDSHNHVEACRGCGAGSKCVLPVAHDETEVFSSTTAQKPPIPVTDNDVNGLTTGASASWPHNFMCKSGEPERMQAYPELTHLPN